MKHLSSLFHPIHFFFNPHMAEFKITFIESQVCVDNIDVLLKDITKYKTVNWQEPTFFLCFLNSILMVLWSAERRIHGKDLAEVGAEIVD